MSVEGRLFHSSYEFAKMKLLIALIIQIQAFFLVSGGHVDFTGPKWVKFTRGGKCSNAVPLATDINDTQLIIRIPFREVPLGGVEKVLNYRLDSIPLLGNEWPSREYEMLCGELVKWIKSEILPVPEGAVVSRLVETTNINGTYLETYYVCKGLTRLPHKWEYFPGERYPNGTCVTNFRGKEVVHRSGYYILRKTNTTESIKWVKYSDENSCSNDVITGSKTSEKKPPRFLGRRQINESSESGKLIPIYIYTWIPIDDESEIDFSDYEVLCADSVDWEYSHLSTSLRGAVVSHEDEAFYSKVRSTDTYYVCRAVADDGRTYLGELSLSFSSGACQAYIGEKPFWRFPGEFEFLVEYNATG